MCFGCTNKLTACESVNRPNLALPGDFECYDQSSQPAKIRERHPDHDQDEHDYGGERYGTAGFSKACASRHGLIVGSLGNGEQDYHRPQPMTPIEGFWVPMGLRPIQDMKVAFPTAD